MLELVVKHEVELIGVEIYLHRGIDRTSNKAKVEKPAEQINAVKNDVGVDAVRARGGRLEITTCEWRRERFGKVDVNFKTVVGVQAGQTHIETGVSSHLCDDFLCIVHLVGGHSGFKKTTHVALNRHELRR